MIRWILPLGLAACSATTPAPEALPQQQAVCNAEKVQSFVGQTATADLGAEAMRLSGSRTIRWIQGNQPVTMDYRQDRLNIGMSTKNVIERISCG